MAEPRTYTLDPNWASFEVGAFLLALLAYPDPAKFEMLSDTADALCARKINATCKAYPETADAWRAAYPRYTALSSDEIKRRLKPLRRLHRDRMLAARMALGWLEEGITGEAAKLPTGMARHSLDELAILIAAQANLTDPHLVKRRQWRPTGGVIHLAAAIQVTMRSRDPGPSDFGYDIEDESLNRQVIDLALILEKIVLSDDRFGPRRIGRLITVQWPQELAA